MSKDNAATELCELLDHLNGAYAPNTLRAYRADMTEFIAYCQDRNLSPLPACHSTVAAFLMQTLHQQIKTATIRRKAASISAIHRLSYLADPTKHPEVKISLRKISRQLGTKFDQAYPITRRLLDNLLTAACRTFEACATKRFCCWRMTQCADARNWSLCALKTLNGQTTEGSRSYFEGVKAINKGRGTGFTCPNRPATRCRTGWKPPR